MNVKREFPEDLTVAGTGEGPWLQPVMIGKKESRRARKPGVAGLIKGMMAPNR
jgi:hypothetical protein